MMEETTIKYNGLEFDVSYEQMEGQNGGHSNPSWAAGVDVSGVKLKGHDVDICDLLDGHWRWHWSEVEGLIIEQLKDNY